MLASDREEEEEGGKHKPQWGLHDEALHHGRSGERAGKPVQHLHVGGQWVSQVKLNQN